MRSKLGLVALTAILCTQLLSPAHALSVPNSFIKYASSLNLANPGIVLMDPTTSDVIYSTQPDVGRAPASVMKLLSATLASTALDLNSSFHTSISTTAEPDRYVLTGDFDPWLTLSAHESSKFGAALSPELINKAIAQTPGAKRIVIDYYGLYDKDLEELKKFYRGRVYLSINKMPSLQVAEAKVVEPISTITSPTISDILKFTLLWSDNTKADRLARLSAKALGFTPDASGIKLAFEKVLTDLGVTTEGLEIYDGSGLSKENRVTARTIAELLVKIKGKPEFAAVYEGLPLAGISGTLQKRFVVDAPTAVGLVKAKTGWINGTVSLAGYVTVGEDQYVFAIIADHIKPTELRRKAARETIDKMLATIAKPKPAISTATLGG
jgi:serine-type D-Ala-D-Ala carboxypeptidase/endopeptidase (penicillin-binding protein 4)